MSAIFKTIRNAVIGANKPMHTPFGVKPLIYADYTASGRSLDIVESFIQQHVLPNYANTHTETSFTGAQTSLLREQARLEIKKAVNAGNEDKVIFCGSGATAAINKLMDILGLRLSASNGRDKAKPKEGDEHNRPVIFVGPYEHHSNELPWRESIAEVITVPLDHSGLIDLEHLEQKLCEYQNRPIIIGSFSAASNVTGVISDVDAITGLLHKYGALSFWDYAAAAPYKQIDMNAKHPIDAVFISPHKFIGGPGTPGILVVKAKLVNNTKPVMIGGGTVSYVTPTKHVYTKDIERREEGGTPAIVETVRAGLVFKLQQDVGVKLIEETEEMLANRAMAFLKKVKNLEVLGSHSAKRLSIFSLRFKHGNKDLHYGFVTALLNDLFGIQARGGCSCAGPYGHSLLNMTEAYSAAIEEEVSKGSMVMRPGWVRLNFNYFIDEAEFNYILQSIKLVAEHGWRLLPYYELDTRSQCWRYQGYAQHLPNSLAMFDFKSKSEPAGYQLPKHEGADTLDYQSLLTEAETMLTQQRLTSENFTLNLPLHCEELRWFVLPQDCYSAQASDSMRVKAS